MLKRGSWLACLGKTLFGFQDDAVVCGGGGGGVRTRFVAPGSMQSPRDEKSDLQNERVLTGEP